MQKKRGVLRVRLLAGVTVVFCICGALAIDNAPVNLQAPSVGDHQLSILAPDLLELMVVNTKPSGASPVNMWDWADGAGNFVPPDFSSLRVIIGGQTNQLSGVGFKRRPLYAPLAAWDVRIGNWLYLRVNATIAEGQTVQVVGDGTLWPQHFSFTAVADPLRYNPAIHVNQEGYLPGFPKKAIVGYYLGSLGEMAIPSSTFSVVNAETGTEVFQGNLTQRSDFGYTYTPTPYQQVYEADFSAVTAPGRYRVKVSGMGASLPFRIDEGIGMNFARTYALGILHQRSGFNVAMPFTRFTHGADHTAPAAVPVNASPPFEFTWTTISNYAVVVNPDNPPQVAPRLTSPAAQLYPFVNTGPVDVSGGHFEAANYSKVPWNDAQIIHILMFAVDAIPGVSELDNLGIPESGDGISDVLQEAKWQADCLAKMQDTDGGFYYMIHPVGREYEYDVLPENGDPQLVWPKNTATTAAAVAALAQCASSPAFKQAYPAEANLYWTKAQLGWQFLTNAFATHGEAGAYQRIMHFGDQFTHTDDLAWAACELFLATGDPAYRSRLEGWFPDPTDPGTTRWGWVRMYASYGNAVRSYATAVKSGRLAEGQLSADYLAKCINAITNCGNDNLQWSQDHAYGSSFPEITKAVRGAGWYYSAEQAFDIMVAQLFHPNPNYVDAILQNLNYEAGCNPVNVAYVTGLGWIRQREVVDQYSANDRRVLPKIGVPLGNIQEGFVWTFTYGGELTALCSPPDGAATAPYPYYDRWSDFWNVTTEASTPNTVRCFATALWLASQTSVAAQGWVSTNATIAVPPGTPPAAQPVTLNLQVADNHLEGARIIWEAQGQEPAFGGLSYTFTPQAQGTYWVEAEVQWPDGRRAFAMNTVNVGAPSPAPVLRNLVKYPGGNFSFLLTGLPGSTCLVLSSTNLNNWGVIASHVLPASGEILITEPEPVGTTMRYYRAEMVP